MEAPEGAGEVGAWLSSAADSSAAASDLAEHDQEFSSAARSSEDLPQVAEPSTVSRPSLRSPQAPSTARSRPSRPVSRASGQASPAVARPLADPPRWSESQTPRSSSRPSQAGGGVDAKKAPTARLKPREVRPTPENAWAASAHAHLKAVRALRDQLQRDIGPPGPGEVRFQESVQEPRQGPKQAVIGSAAAEDQLKRRRFEERAIADAVLDRMEATERLVFEVAQASGALQRLRGSLAAALGVAEKRLELRKGRPEAEQIDDAFQEALESEVSMLRVARSQLKSQSELGKDLLQPLTEARDEVQQRRLTLHVDRTGQAWPFLESVREREVAAERYCKAAAGTVQDVEQRVEKATARTVAAMRKRLAETLDMRRQLEAEVKEARTAIGEAERRLERMQRRLRDHPERDMERSIRSGTPGVMTALASASALAAGGSTRGGASASVASASPWMGKLAKVRQKVKAAAYMGNGRRLDTVFRRMDRDGSGTLCEDEIRCALRRAWKIPAEIISDAEVSLLFNMLDSHRSGYVGIDDLIDFLTTDADVEALEEQVASASGTLEQLRQALDTLVEELHCKTLAWKIDEVCSRVTPTKGLDLQCGGLSSEKPGEPSQRRPRQSLLKPESIDALKSRTTRAALEVVFSRFDREGTGILDDAEVQQALRRTLRIPPSVFSDEDIASLCTMLGADNQGGVSLHELIEFVGSDSDGFKPRGSPLALDRAGTPSTAASAGSRAQTPLGCASGSRSLAGTPTLGGRRRRPKGLPPDVVEGLRTKIRAAACAAAAGGRCNGAELVAVFSRFDKDGTGRLEADDVRSALRRLRLPPKAISDAEIATLCSMLDPSGAVGVHQLVEFIGG